MTIKRPFGDFVFPSLPNSVLRILELVRDPNVDFTELSRAIELDPALASRVVRLANSAYYGRSHEVSNVRRAVVTVGQRTLRLTVLSFSLIKTLDPRTHGSDLQQAWRFSEIWRRILTNAIGARLAAPHFDVDREDAFLAGLMQDIMLLAFGICHTDAYFAILDKSYSDAGPLLSDLEREDYGTHHAEQASQLMEQWHFPSHVVNAVAWHHGPIPEGNEPEHRLARLLSFVERVTLFFLHPTPWNAAALDDLARVLKDPGSAIDDFVQKLDAELLDLADILDLALAGGRKYDEVLQEARSAVEECVNVRTPVEGTARRA